MSRPLPAPGIYFAAPACPKPIWLIWTKKTAGGPRASCYIRWDTMHLNTKGLVIRTVDWRDSDRLLTVMTEDYGKITVKAQGIRRRGSRFGAAGQLFAYCDFTLYERGGRMTLQDAQVVQQFFRLSEDLDALALASYFCELLATEGEEDVPVPGLLRLALNSLYALANHVSQRELVKAAFELRFLAIVGYEPDLWRCASCGAEPQEPQVNLQAGQLHCAKCRAAFRQGVSMPLSRAALQAARYILRCDLKKLFSWSIPAEDLALLGAFTENYCLVRLERGFKTLDFYKSLQVGGLYT